MYRVDGEDVEVREGDFLRFDPETTRCPVAGPNGMTLIAVGAPRPAPTTREGRSSRDKEERTMLTEDRLRTLLRVAESAHAAYETELGHGTTDWPTWYAQFIVARWQEEPGGGTHELFSTTRSTGCSWPPSTPI